ncbi:MAG: hypothetical protein ACQKBV_06360 [Puniceicoccales bacterium]
MRQPRMVGRMLKPLGEAVTRKLPDSWDIPRPQSGWSRDPALATSLAAC